MKLPGSPTTTMIRCATAAMVGTLTAVCAVGAAGVVGAPAADAETAAAPVCGATLTQDTLLRRNLDCTGSSAAVALRLRPGVLLDLGGFTITVKGTRRSVVIAALGGQATTTEILNGSLVGGRGIAMTGTDDALDAGRQQLLRLSNVTTLDADLDVTHASARLYRTTMMRPALGMDHGLLDVVRSTLTDVDAGAIGADPDPGNVWNLTTSSVSGSWWSSGDTRVVDSQVVDTDEPGARTPTYGDLVITGSDLQGPVYPITALAGEHMITDTKVDRSGGFVVDDLLTVSGSNLRRLGTLDSGATGTTVVTDTDFNSPNGASVVRGHQVQVTDSTFRNTTGVAVSGDNVEVTGTSFRGGHGTDVVVGGTLTASGNSLRNNDGVGLHSQGGAATITRNSITGQAGDGISFDAGPDQTPPSGEFRVGRNRVRDGLGWGILTFAGTDPAQVVDLGGNIASGNALGQCSAPLVCAAG